MTKKERIEDLGIIYERLNRIVIDFEEWFAFYNSKHAYEIFQEHMLDKDCDKLEDLHRKLRYLIENLNEVVYIARGEIEE